MQTCANSYTGVAINMLNEEQLRALHGAILKVLSRTGILVEDENAVRIFADHGAQISKKDNRTTVRLPEVMVEKAIQTAPSEVFLESRSTGRGKNFNLRHGQPTRFTIFPNNLSIIDPVSRKPRRGTMDDLCNGSKIIEHLDNIDLVQNLIDPLEAPAQTMSVHLALGILPYVSKPFRIYYNNGKTLKQVLEMERMVAADLGQNPRQLPIAAPTSSPLCLGRAGCESALIGVEEGQIIAVGNMPMAGATGPMDLAGTVVVGVAEALALITLVQLANPGNPTLYFNYASQMDLRTAVGLTGSPEGGLISMAVAGLFRMYDIPCASGFTTDSKWCDYQSGFEKAMMVMSSSLSGNPLVFLGGGLESGLCWDHSQALLDNEMAGTLKHLSKGLEVTEKTLSVDLIDEIGPMGNYFMAPSTIEKMRSASAYELMDRKTRNPEIHRDHLTTLERVNREALKMIDDLNDFKLISDSCLLELHQFVTECDREAGVK